MMKMMETLADVTTPERHYEIVEPHCGHCLDRVGLVGPLEVDATGTAACADCYVPDITSERYAGTTDDFLVAAPNVRRVR